MLICTFRLLSCKLNLFEIGSRQGFLLHRKLSKLNTIVLTVHNHFNQQDAWYWACNIRFELLQIKWQGFLGALLPVQFSSSIGYLSTVQQYYLFEIGWSGCSGQHWSVRYLSCTAICAPLQNTKHFMFCLSSFTFKQLWKHQCLTILFVTMSISCTTNSMTPSDTVNLFCDE